MNFFRGINEFLELIFEENPVIAVILGVLTYSILYFIGWAVFGFFLPWVLVLLIPLLILPFFTALGSFHISRLGLSEDESTGFGIVFLTFVLVALVYVSLFGIPYYKPSVIWELMNNESFKEFYFFGFIKSFWNLWDHLNYFSDGENIPYKFYVIRVDAFQWAFWGGYVIVSTYIQFSLHSSASRERDEKIAKRQAQAEKAQKEFEDHQRALRLEEKREAASLLRAKQEKLERERLDKRKAESESKDPWDSGFLG